MKLRQNGTVSFSIRLGARGQRRRLYETTFNSMLFRLQLMVGGSGFCLHPAAFQAGQPRLNGQSRLNHRQAQMSQTAPTIQKQPIPNYKVSFSIRLTAFQAKAALI